MVARPESEKESRPVRSRLEFVTRRPVAITMLMVAVAVFGAVSLGKLPVDLLPEISYPTLTVRTTWRGAAPEDVEDRLSERIQEALSTLPRLVRSASVSRAETSDVILDFDWGTPMTFAVQDVRDRLDGVFLPDGAERPLILRYDPNLDPILRIALSVPEKKDAAGAAKPGALSAERSLIHLRWLAENRVKRELETLPGLAAVQVRGGLEEEIRVRVDPFKLAALGLDPAAVATRLTQENLNTSGGSIREGSTEYLVRTLNEFRDISEIEDLAIVRRGDAAVRIRDIATVTRTHAEREVITRLDGREAVEIAVYREAGANIVALAEEVRERVFGTEEQQRAAAEQQGRAGGAPVAANLEERSQADYLAHRLREDVRFEVLSDQSTFIRDAVDDVKSSAWMGVILTVLVIWLALRSMTSTQIISVSIPISVIATFAPMYLLDVSLNIMSLGGLALGVGMVVDASIVVLESIITRREAGDGLREATVRGTREVAGAITGSTLTSIAVFAPIVFVHGVAGKIFGDQALTVVSSLVVSLAVALLFIPVLASRPWLAATTGFAPGRLLEWLAWPLRPLLWLHDAVWNPIERAYPRVLASALDHAWIVVLLSVGLFGLAAWRVPKLGLDLLPEIHQAEFTAHVALPVGSPLPYTDGVLSDLEREIRTIDGVAITALTVGVEKDTLTRQIEGKHTGRLTVRLDKAHASAESEEHIVSAVRSRIAANPAVRSVEITRPNPFAIAAPVQVEVLGWDLDKLAVTASDVAERLSRVEGLSDVRTTVRPGHPEIRITFDRDKTLEYGLDLDAVSRLVRDQVLGNVSTRFAEGDDRIDVRVIGDEIILGELDRVLDLAINPTAAVSIPLRDVATIAEVQGPAEIRRIGNTRAVVVSAASSGLDLGGLTSRIEAALADLSPPEDVAVQIGGQKLEMDEAQRGMRFALVLAMFLVYAVMASQFESLIQPLIILVTVPLAFVGVVFALDLLGIPLSVVVFIGMILLAGIVVSNAIVLLDRVNQTRALGWSVRESLLEAGRTRLRPIYMTANTTVIGLLPLSGWLAPIPWIGDLSSGAGVELRAPMAIAVMAGLTCSTVLTLIVIPAVYSLIFDRKGARA